MLSAGELDIHGPLILGDLADHRFPGGNDAALVTPVAGRIGGIEPQVVAA